MKPGEKANAAGFRMIAEWRPHAACWIAWPKSEPTFGDTLGEARRECADVVRAIARFEPVCLLHDPDSHDGIEVLREVDGVELIACPLDDSWLRDSGPTFVSRPDGAIAGIDWTFDGWGGLYPHERDDNVARFIIERAGAARFRSEMVFEGGALSVDDCGTVLITQQCFEHRTRNGGPDRAEFEAELAQQLGARKVIWLKRSLEGDSTNGHVDVVAAFSAPGEVVVQTSDDPSDPDYGNLLENKAILESETDADGRPLRVCTVTSPPVRRKPDGARRMMSYINFYIANGGVVVPQYGFDDADAAALARLRGAFPDREVVGVLTPRIADAGGNIHCITQQQPLPETPDA
ncbi:hypothetical protein AVO45_05775 [Ruegeria marisrubri]|uniref:Agmatine deiminase n=1 Tax=Ruegeria marisrubri TaxID=1685379 RepID=A0A0X3TXV7_9RHOB|nr:agmatine deiminase family protein [Ruegeria marisrubri]KUJ80555.1 hypothetical protein AVO45_05775 [Ruegeria marisrubri]